MLKGQAKTDYQREYMRRRRAGAGVKPRVAKAAPVPPPPAPAPVKRCSFCGEPATDRLMVGDGLTFICEPCVAEAAALIAVRRAGQ